MLAIRFRSDSSGVELVAINISNPTEVLEVKRIKNAFPNTGPTFLFMEEFEPDDCFKVIDKKRVFSEVGDMLAPKPNLNEEAEKLG